MSHPSLGHLLPYAVIDYKPERATKIMLLSVHCAVSNRGSILVHLIQFAQVLPSNGFVMARLNQVVSSISANMEGRWGPYARYMHKTHNAHKQTETRKAEVAPHTPDDSSILAQYAVK